MLKITDTQNGNVRWILTEQERYSLSSQEAKDFVKDKINNLNKYISKDDRAICFFSEKPLVHYGEAKNGENQGWYFNVEKDGRMYPCMYSIEGNLSGIAKEAYTLLIWRQDVSSGYTEHIGDDIRNGIRISVKDTTYNEIQDYRLNPIQNEIAEEVALTMENAAHVKRWMLK